MNKIESTPQNIRKSITGPTWEMIDESPDSHASEQKKMGQSILTLFGVLIFARAFI